MNPYDDSTQLPPREFFVLLVMDIRWPSPTARGSPLCIFFQSRSICTIRRCLSKQSSPSSPLRKLGWIRLPVQRSKIQTWRKRHCCTLRYPSCYPTSTDGDAATNSGLWQRASWHTGTDPIGRRKSRDSWMSRWVILLCSWGIKFQEVHM